MEKLILNGFEVDPRLFELMRRSDWPMSRGRRSHANAPLLPNSQAWLKTFKSSENTGLAEGIVAISFLSVEQARINNKNLKKPELQILFGQSNDRSPPGNFDPNFGYLIGLTDDVDEGIFVDLRPPNGPSVTYSNHNANGVQIVTAFQSIDTFVQFYLEQHD